jgi:hypothetical protein
MLNTLPVTDNLVSLSNSEVKRYRELYFIVIKINDKSTSGVGCVCEMYFVEIKLFLRDK